MPWISCCYQPTYFNMLGEVGTVGVILVFFCILCYFSLFSFSFLSSCFRWLRVSGLTG